MKINTKFPPQSRSLETVLRGQDSSPAALKFSSGSQEFTLELARSEKAGVPEDVPWKCQLTHNMKIITITAAAFYCNCILYLGNLGNFVQSDLDARIT